MTEKCPFCNSNDYEIRSYYNTLKRTNQREYRCLKCGRKWIYKNKQIIEVKE